MNMKSYSVSAVLSAFLLGISFQISAQIVDISACRAIESRLERFDCYESLEENPGASHSPQTRQQQASPSSVSPASTLPQSSAEPGQAPVNTRAQDVADYGRASTTEGKAKVIEGDDGKSELLDTVADLKKVGPNMWLVTLESGQRWRQVTGKRYMLYKGDQVRIYPTEWGSSFRMTSERVGSYIQVKRLD